MHDIQKIRNNPLNVVKPKSPYDTHLIRPKCLEDIHSIVLKIESKASYVRGVENLIEAMENLYNVHKRGRVVAPVEISNSKENIKCSTRFPVHFRVAVPPSIIF